MTAHPTDDQGFPLNPDCCEACKTRSQRMNDRALIQLLGMLKPVRNWTAEWDNEGDQGREVFDYDQEKPSL